MKIIIVNGSPRTQGLTASFLHSIERNLRSKLEDPDIEFFDLSRLSMYQCTGCCSCYATGHCHMKDDAELLYEKIRNADALILGSPTYAGNVSGYMKLLIDRGHFVIEQLLTGKYCVTVATGENYGVRDASRILNNLVLYSGGNLCDKIVMNAPFNGMKEVSDKIDRLGQRSADRLCSAITGRRFYLFQHIFHLIVLNLGIRRFVLKKGVRYQGVIDKWKELGIM